MFEVNRKSVYPCFSLLTKVCLLTIPQLSQIGRCEYEKTCTLLVQLFDEAAQKYQNLVNASGDNAQITVQEGKYSVRMIANSLPLMQTK